MDIIHLAPNLLINHVWIIPTTRTRPDRASHESSLTGEPGLEKRTEGDTRQNIGSYVLQRIIWIMFGVDKGIRAGKGLLDSSTGLKD